MRMRSLDLPSLVSDSEAKYIVDMLEKEEGYLERALDAYILLAGTPSLILGGSDFTTAEKVLQRYGKSFKTGFFTKFLKISPDAAKIYVFSDPKTFIFFSWILFACRKKKILKSATHAPIL